MAYQSKTYSLSDEVVAAIEAAKAKGESPNKFLRRLLGIDGATIRPVLPPYQKDDLWSDGSKRGPRSKERKQ